MKPSQHPSAAGFILAGGRSSRMGTDKTLALIAGKPLIQIALETLAAAGLATRIAGSRSSLAAYAEEIPDTFPETASISSQAIQSISKSVAVFAMSALRLHPNPDNTPLGYFTYSSHVRTGCRWLKCPTPSPWPL